MNFDIKKYKNLMLKISKNAYFRNLKEDIKNKLVDIDDILKTESFLWDHQIDILNNVLKIYKIFDTIKKNKNFIKIQEHLIKYIDFESLESTFKIKLEYLYYIEKNTTENNDCIYLYKYKIIKITEQETIQND